MANVITDLQVMLTDLRTELRSSHDENARLRSDIQALVAQATNPTQPPQVPSTPDSTRSSQVPPSTKTNKSASLGNIVVQSIKNQEQLLKTFIQTM